MTMPNFLIVGAQKAGTTSIYYHLKHHPEVFMSAVKEPQFFAVADGGELAASGPGDARANPISTLAEYQALFAEAGDAKAAGEASTIYLYSERAPGRIKHHLPDVKVIAILRDPAERAYSNYMHLIRDGREPIADFERALEEEETRRAQGWSANWRYLDKGFYAGQLERYFRTFGADQLRVYLYEDFCDDPAAVMADIYRYLGVREDVSQDLSLRLNVAGVPRSKGMQSLVKRQERLKWLIDPLISERLRRRLLSMQNHNLVREGLAAETRARLIDVYHEDIGRVAELTGLDVSRWLEVERPGAAVAA